MTPAKNAPKAGDNPIATINSETPITRNREEAVNNSVIPAFETYLKKGTKTYLPNKIKITTPKITVPA